MRIALLLAAVLFPGTALAQIVTGPAKAIDGDMLELGGQRIRLHGIDAPEVTQVCTRGGAAWGCGREAAQVLAGFVDGQQVECTMIATDDQTRKLAACKVNDLDLGASMIEAGLALAVPKDSGPYTETEARIRGLGLGLWGSTFSEPAAFRAANPGLFKLPVRSAPSRVEARPARAIFWRSCGEAWAAGMAPLYIGKPGYRSQLDGDGDGIACEPIRGRR